jgi:hypothetical protein
MNAELEATDISNLPELLRLAEEVVASRSPRLLRRGDQAMVIVSPVESAPGVPEGPRRASPRFRARCDPQHHWHWRIP